MPLRPAQRYALVQALTDFIVPLSYSEANAIMRAVRSSSIIPSSWDSLSPDIRVTQARALLSIQSDGVLIGLEEFLPENEQITQIRTASGLIIPETTYASEPPIIAEKEQAFDGPIFVVHGHAHAVLHEAVRVLERGTNREVIVLHEQANAGRTILEKFEEHAAAASFAVVLLTGDDEGGPRSGTGTQLRGRQNVIFELGFFFGKLGRRRVAVLLEDDIEKPSDIDGLVYISLDQAGTWKYNLARELEAVDIPVDRSRIP